MWKLPSSLLPSLLLLWPLTQVHAANFTFAYGSGTECDPFQVSWTGGVAPFRLTFLPSYGTLRAVNIPSDAFNSDQGSFSTPLPIQQGKQFVAVMSDSSGFASGGVSEVITVGASNSGTRCNTTDPSAGFSFETPSALQQCRPYVFSNYVQTGAVLPVTITGVVPGGSSFVLNLIQATSFSWKANAAAGTNVGFFMQDANGLHGGVTQFLPIAMSDTSACLNSNSPSSVTNAPSMTSSSASKPTGSTSGTSVPNPTDSSNGTTIAAAIVGVAVAMLVLGTLIWFYLRRRNGGTSVFGGSYFGRRFRKEDVDLLKVESNLPPAASLSPYPLYHPQGRPGTPNSTAHLIAGRRSDSASGFGAIPSTHFGDSPNSTISAQFPSSPHTDTVPGTSLTGGESGYGSGYGGSSYGYGTAAAAAARAEGTVSSWDPATSSAARRKAAEVGVPAYQAPARYILHADIEDDIPPPAEEDIIELPPQYSERRAPLPPMDSDAGNENALGTPRYDSRPS